MIVGWRGLICRRHSSIQDQSSVNLFTSTALASFALSPIPQSCENPVSLLEKKEEYNEAVHQLFIDFKKAYDSVRREVLYNILIEFSIPMKLVRLILINLCPHETCSTVQVDKHLPHMIPIKKGWKQRGASSLLLCNFALEYATRKFQVRQDGLKLSGRHQLLVHAGDVSILDGYINSIKENTEVEKTT